MAVPFHVVLLRPVITPVAASTVMGLAPVLPICSWFAPVLLNWVCAPVAPTVTLLALRSLAMATSMLPLASTEVMMFLPASNLSASVFAAAPLTLIVLPNAAVWTVPLLAVNFRPLLVKPATWLFKSPAFTAL